MPAVHQQFTVVVKMLYCMPIIEQPVLIAIFAIGALIITVVPSYLPYDGYEANKEYEADLAKKADAKRVKAEADAIKAKAKKRDRKPKEEPAE